MSYHNLPAVIIVGTDEVDLLEIVKGILDEEELPQGKSVVEGIIVWPWQVDNKYYTASVNLAVVTQPLNHLAWILNHGEALVLYFSANKNDGLAQASEVLSALEDYEPETQLLVCDLCSPENSGGGVKKIEAQKWCIARGWELVELNRGKLDSGDQHDEEEEEEDFPESLGAKRIRQALHAHTWSNLILKETPGHGPTSILQALTQSEGILQENNDNNDVVPYSALEELTLDSSQPVMQSNGINNSIEGQDLSIDDELDPALRGLTCEGESFENLFSRFDHLKRTAATLPHGQRREYAEKVAVAFWRAMGGDEEEVLGLDSDLSD